MPCSLPNDFAWTPLLAARELLSRGVADLVFAQRGGAWSCEAAADAALHDADAALLVGGDDARRRAADVQGAVTFYETDARGLPALRRVSGADIDERFAAAARVYLPVLLGAAAARRAGRSFVVGHVTQTLDGRIACENGQSQWIGNQADLHHAHRMRALCDGVLVGANTALGDDPLLNVRHVEGPGPRRIVLSGRGRVLTADPALQLLQGPGCDVLVGERHAAAPPSPQTRVHAIDGADDHLDLDRALAALRDQGVGSIYLEGGAGTLSSFLRAGLVDLLQVHIAAMVLGSGLPSLRLPAVEHVDQGLRVQMDHATLDGHLLLTCVPARP